MKGLSNDIAESDPNM